MPSLPAEKGRGDRAENGQFCFPRKTPNGPSIYICLPEGKRPCPTIIWCDIIIIITTTGIETAFGAKRYGLSNAEINNGDSFDQLILRVASIAQTVHCLLPFTSSWSGTRWLCVRVCMQNLDPAHGIGNGLYIP